MYIKDHSSFVARAKHENLHGMLLSFTDGKNAHKLIDRIKLLNQKKDVIYTCIEVTGDNIYKNIIWEFAYKNNCDRELVYDYLLGCGATQCSHDNEFIGSVMCPFRGN